MNPGRAHRTEPTRNFSDRAAESDRYRDIVADDLVEERGSSAGHSAQWPPFVADTVRDHDRTCQPEPGAQLLLQGHEEAQVSEDGDLYQPALAGLLEQPGDLDPGQAESGRDFLVSQVELVVKPGCPGHQVVLTHHVKSLPVRVAGLGACDAGTTDTQAGSLVKAVSSHCPARVAGSPGWTASPVPYSYSHLDSVRNRP